MLDNNHLDELVERNVLTMSLRKLVSDEMNCIEVTYDMSDGGCHH
jgi:hypothetical protein